MSDGSVFFTTMKSQFVEQSKTATPDRLDRQARLQRLERKLGRRRDHNPGWLSLLNASWLLQLGARWLRQLSPRWRAS